MNRRKRTTERVKDSGAGGGAEAARCYAHEDGVGCVEPDNKQKKTLGKLLSVVLTAKHETWLLCVTVNQIPITES